MDSVKFFLPQKKHYREKWGDRELDFLSGLIYHPVYGLIYRYRYRMADAIIPEASCGLEVGCGYGQFLPMLLEKVDSLHAVDMHQYLGKVKEVQQKEGLREVRLCRGNIFHLPYKKGSFDLVVCLSVLEHLNNLEPAILELKRVLKESGKLIVGFPIKNKVTKMLFKLIGRDDEAIHPQSYLSLTTNLSRHFALRQRIVFPKYFPLNMGLYFVGEFRN